MPTKIPHAPRRPIIGNLHQISGEDIMQKLIDYADPMHPISELKILHFKMLFITRLDLAKEVMDDEYFHKFLDEPVMQLRHLAGDGLFTSWTHESNWKKAHNILIPAFAHKAISNYATTMGEIINELITSWQKLPKGTWINLADAMTDLTFETIGLCGFDYKFNMLNKNKEQHPFIEAMLFSLNEVVWRARTPAFLRPLRFKSNRLFKKHVDYMNNVIDNIIEQRRKEGTADEHKTDLLQLMLSAKDPETGELLSNENIRYQILTFLIAGHETTSSTLAFAFYNLLKHPEYLAKAYEEVDRVLGRDLDQPVSSDTFMELEFIRKVLMETLRLYPPVPLINVASKKDTTIGKAEYPIKANKSIYIFTYHLHRDKKHWGEKAEEFNPHNFDRSAIAKRDRDAFKAFGNGQRSCIGQHFALLEAALAMAKILQHFELSMRPDYVLKFFPSPALKPDNLEIQIKPRQ